jgi:CheY-like chemotaxis protein
MRISLRKLGYRIITSRSGSEAVEIIEAGDSEIDLVILDVIMKGMSGAETFKELRDLKPDLPVILCTGYAHDTVAKKLITAGARDFIQKPFKMKDLSLKIRGVLA